MNIKIFYLLISISLCLQAVIIQHDTPVKNYRAFANNSLFDGVGKLSINGRHCTGVLIDERTVLTSRHCITSFNKDLKNTFSLPSELKQYSALPDDSFGLIGVRRPLENKAGPHPGLPLSFFEVAQDLAIVYLDTPIFKAFYPHLATSPLPPRGTIGQQAFICGYGQFGYAHRQGSDTSIGKLAGISRVISNNIFVNYPKTIPFVTLHTRLEHEGIGQLGSAPAYGDSGGPLFVLDGQGSPILLGLASRIDWNSSHENAMNYLKNHKITSDEDIKILRTEQPLPLKQHEFLGYQSERSYTYLGGFNGFINQARAMVESYSEPNASTYAHYWSQSDRWHHTTSRLSLQKPMVSNNGHYNDDRGLLPTFFKVWIRGTVFADMEASVDALTLDKANSYLNILHYIEIKSDKTLIDNGAHLRIDGSLVTKRLNLKQGRVSGQGIIRMNPGIYEGPALLEQQPVLIFSNSGGHIDLSNNYSPLGVDGNYVHEANGQVSVRVGEMGASSLAIRKKATIRGGTITIHLGALYNSNLLTTPSRKWTVLTAKSGIRGNFTHFVVTGNFNKNSPYRAQITKSNDKRSLEFELIKK